MASTASRDQILALMREQLDLIRAKESGTRVGSDPEELRQMRAAVGGSEPSWGRPGTCSTPSG